MNKTADILVIDDEQVIIDAVIKICSLDNYSVDSAINVKTAIEKISKNYYPIIICDIMMPDGDGFKILDELHRKNFSSALIMMTGYSTVENAVNSLYKGAVDFVPKPFTVDELLSSVNRAINYRRIKDKQSLLLNNKNNNEILYVSCPAKYLRLGYSSWIFQEREGSVLFGVCDLFIKTIDSIQEIEFQNTDNEIAQGICCASFKCDNDRIHKILSPISGRIVEINEKIKSTPSIVEKDPYFEGWIYRIIPANIDYEIKYLIPCSSDRL
jgi:FixJ family two-component response regulator/glycine cleavage system H lipoate-binding protein